MNFAFKIIVPLLLLITATLKFIKFIDNPYNGILNSPLLELSSIYIEYLISFLILSSYKEDKLLIISKILFLFYSVIGIINIVNNQATCGCLGIIEANVKYITILNIIIFSSLCFCNINKNSSKITDTYKILLLSSLMTYLSFFAFFSIIDNPERQFKIIKGHHLITNNSVFVEDSKELYIILENVSDKPIDIIGLNSDKNIVLGTKLPMTIKEKTKIKIPFGFKTNDLLTFKANLNLMISDYPNVLKIKIIGKGK
jgi:hypothetical protein